MTDSDHGPREAQAIPRRHLTILFADLSRFTALAGSVEPEYCLAVVSHFKECSRRVVSKHGGIVVDFRGDSVMAMFGYPQPSEHDGHRATDAALEMRDAIRQMPASGVELPPLRLHSGIHSGPVLLLEDDPVPGQYAVIGEASSVAARLSDIATDGEILVSATTLGGESHFFEIRELGELALHGKAEPVPVIQVLGHSPASTRYEARTQGGLTPFVGRASELEVLRRALDEVVGGASRELAIVASGGVGKTRLVEQFLQSISPASAQVCRGYCENYLGAQPLQPFLQVLRQLTPPSSGEAESGSDAETSPPRTPDASIPAICERVAAAARVCPLVLFVDDWQWADDASKHVLATLRGLKLPSVLVLTASREALDAGRDVRALELSPLTDDEAADAITTLRPDVDPLAARRILQLSGGNPLFIEELCHRAVHASAILETGSTAGLPAWLSTLIESRVSRLPQRLSELVRVAAVLGKVIPVWLFEQVSGCRADDQMLRELAERDLIYPGDLEGTVRFKHGITRDVIYASVGLLERETLHRRIAELLERRAGEIGYESLLEALSYHWRGGARPERTAHYAELAGDKALAAAAPDRARSQYAAALAALESLEASDDVYRGWSRIVHRFGLACVFDPTRDQLHVFGRASDWARQRGDDLGLAQAEYWLGFIRYALGDVGTALGHYERAGASCARALDRARQGGDDKSVHEMEALGVQLMAAIGQARAAAGEHEVALRLLDDALDVKRRHRHGGRPAVGSAYALACKGASLGDLGRFAEAYECFDEALAVIRAGHPAVEGSVLGWRSAVSLWHGRWLEARTTARRSQSLAQAIWSLYGVAMGQSVVAYATWMLERTPASIEVITRATAWLEARDKCLLISLNYGWLADITSSMTDVKGTRLHAARAIRRARWRDPAGAAMAYRALARVPSRHGDCHAELYLARAMHVAKARGSAREEAVTWLHQAQHAARTAQHTVARELLTRARAAFTTMDMQWHDQEAERCQTALEASDSGS